MKKIEKEIQRVEKVVTFEAIDGEIFKTEQECKTYEESINNTIKGKWATLKKTKPKDAYEMLANTGCEDKVYLVELESETDVNIINAYMDSIFEQSDKYRAKYEDVGKDVIVVVGYDWCCCYGTIEHYLDEIRGMWNKLINELRSTETE